MTPEELTPILREQIDPDLVVTGVVRGPVGNGQEMWFVDALVDGKPRSLVLRRSQPGPMEWTDREAEYNVLRSLAGHGLPIPAVYAVDPEGGALGSPYLVMERCSGVLPRRLEGEERRAIGRGLGAWIARLHALDPAELGYPAQEPTRALVVAEIRRWKERYLTRRAAPVPLLGALFAWLERNVPDDDVPAVLLWGDPGPHNMLIENGEVSAMLDWELAHVGHPADDLGCAIWACFGVVDPDDVVAGYEDESGRAVSKATLDYFFVLACASRSVALVNGVAAFAAGDATAPTLAGLGLDLLALTLERGAAAAGWGPLPAPDGLAPALDLAPSPTESARGVARFLLADVLPTVEDARLRRSLRGAAALLDAAARRAEIRERAAPPVEGDVEAAAVRAEESGDCSLRAALLADLARVRDGVEPLTEFHGHPRLAR